MPTSLADNPPEKAGPILPEAIYLDANALLQLPESEENEHAYHAFRALAEKWQAPIYAPDVAVCEWKQRKLLDLRNNARQVRTSWRRLSRFMTLGEPPALDDGELSDCVLHALDELLETFGIRAINTPRNVELAEITDMAVRKVRPFEEKGEKGFRDTVILMTLIEHMRTGGLKNALLVSGDEVYDHQDVAARLHGHGLAVVRASGFGDAMTRMKDAGQYAAIAALGDWSRRIVEFANSRLNDIWEHIRHTMTIPAKAWYKVDFDEPTILRVLDARPLRVSSAMPSIEPEPKNPGFEFAAISIEVELDVVARYTTRAILLNRTEFSLSVEREFEPVEHSGYGRTEKRTTLTRTVLVEVEMKVDGGSFVDIAVRDKAVTEEKPGVILGTQ